MEGGLKRWEIGDVASRIAQLYYNFYLRSSGFSYLMESFSFYDAIHSRKCGPSCCTGHAELLPSASVKEGFMHVPLQVLPAGV